MGKSDITLAVKAIEWGKALKSWAVGGAAASAAVYSGYHVLSGDGLIGAGIKGAFGDKAKQAYDVRGMWGGVMEAGFGNVNADKDAADYVTQKVRSGADAVGQQFQKLTGGDPAPGAAAMPQPHAYPIDYSRYQDMTMDNMTGNMGLGGLISNLFGGGGGQQGGFNLLKMLPILPAAFLLFGNSGFMGKAAGLSIAWLMYQMMNRGQQQQRQQQLLQQQLMVRQYGQAPSPAMPAVQVQADPYSEDQPVRRSRHI